VLRLSLAPRKLSCRQGSQSASNAPPHGGAFASVTPQWFTAQPSHGGQPSLRPTQIYIVGGIVDHNRYKLLTLEKAENQVRRDDTYPDVSCTAQRNNKVSRPLATCDPDASMTNLVSHGPTCLV
jgi:hypothetical protein